MEDRCVLEHIDYKRGVYIVDGKEYEMRSCHFPTVDPEHPNELTPEEYQLMERLHHSFRVSEKLQKHIKMLLSHGCMYSICNQNLLYHASVPLNPDGTLKEVELYKGEFYTGKELMHNIGMMVR
jgi:fructose-1,6-bisphosphatase-3